MGTHVYVAAPFADGAFVREHVHERLASVGATPTSTWVHASAGPEDFSRYTIEALREAAARNDADIRRSDVVLALARDGAGGEMFAEVRYALEIGRPVLWVGRRILSAWRVGVVRCDDLDDALTALRSWGARRTGAA